MWRLFTLNLLLVITIKISILLVKEIDHHFADIYMESQKNSDIQNSHKEKEQSQRD